MLQQVFLIQNLTLLWQRFMTLVIPKVVQIQVQKHYITDLYIPECKISACNIASHNICFIKCFVFYSGQEA